MNLTYGEVFAGIGAANAAFQPLGWHNKFFIEKRPIALLQYLFNWDDEFYGGVLSSYHNNRSLNLSDKATYARLLQLAVNYQSKEKKGDLYLVNQKLQNYWDYPDIEAYREYRDAFKVDVAMTSPPCQSFSISGKKGGLSAEKGDLFFETHRFLELTLPKVFILENVPGMMGIKEKLQYDDMASAYSVKRFGKDVYRHDQYLLPFQPRVSDKPRSTFYDIILPSLGVSANTTVYPRKSHIIVWRALQNKIVALTPLPYKLKFLIVGAPSFGSPMQRERVFLVGFREDINSSSFKFNIPRHVKTKSVLDFINPDARLTRSFRYNLYRPGSYGWSASASAKKMIDVTGFTYNPDAEPYISTFLTKEDPRKVAIRMSDGNYRSFADDQMRNLMGFPPGFNSSIVSLTANFVNYGNSIYVPALNHIGKQIEKVLKKNP